MSSAKDELPAVLVTRPFPEADELVRLLNEKPGLQVFRAPLGVIEPTGAALPSPDEADAVLFTSPRGPALAGALAALPAYTVGGATTRAAVAAGFSVHGEGAGQVGRELADIIPPGTRLLHVSGEAVATDPAPLLAPRAITVRRIAVYRARGVTQAPDAMQRFLAAKGLRAATFMSARTAETFARLMTKRRGAAASGPLLALCWSARIEAAARATGVFAETASGGPWDVRGFVDFIRSRCT